MNRVLEYGQKLLNKPDPEDVIFQLGHEFWIGFFAAMADDVSRQGMSVISSTVNTRRYPYPL